MDEYILVYLNDIIKASQDIKIQNDNDSIYQNFFLK